MKLACGCGRRVERVRGSPRCRLDGVRGGKVHRALFSSSQRRGSEFEQAKLGAARGRGRCVHFRALAARQTHFLWLYLNNFNQEPRASGIKALAKKWRARKRTKRRSSTPRDVYPTALARIDTNILTSAAPSAGPAESSGNTQSPASRRRPPRGPSRSRAASE